MKNPKLLLEEALKLYERINCRLEEAMRIKSKMPPRASRTTAYAAFQIRINQLQSLQQSAHSRITRRKNNVQPEQKSVEMPRRN